MKWLMYCFFIPLMSCGLKLEEVKSEILPEVEKNRIQIENLKTNQSDLLNNLQSDVSALEVAVSTIRDRLQDLRIQVIKELKDQNSHLLEKDKLQLDMLEQSRAHLQDRLKGIKALIDQLQAKVSVGESKSPDTDNEIKKP